MRKLYTNSEQISIKINCFLWITSRNPTFKRDDLSDRLILFFLKRRPWFSCDNNIKNEFDKNRNNIMSKMCFDLQNILKNLKYNKEYDTKFRLSDFSNLLKRMNKWEDEKIETILMKLQLNQQELATQTDTLLEIILDLLENREDAKTSIYDWFIEWKEFKASDLHKFFHDYAKNNWQLKYNFNSAMSLWRTLSNNISSYKNIHNILITTRKERSNITLYSISRIKTDD